MANTNKADKEVLDMVTEKTEVKETKPKAKKAPKVITKTEEVSPVTSPELPIYMDVSYWVMDRIIAEVASGKAIEEAISFDARIAGAYEGHPFIVVRESRNAYYYALRADLPLLASTTPKGLGIVPVSFAMPK